ncbi:MAG: winged helix-turn-helix domain-containing protein [Acidobacteria bacterium]|nr:winged helix-turn-helix domain-containing protein [Acidobacteriota bacterium]
MGDDTAISALQRSLSGYREEKRRIQTRLAEIDAEAEMLRSQLVTFNSMIEYTELALRRVLFPDENRVAADDSGHRFYNPPELQAAEIDAEVAKVRQTEKSSNIRFNDFRIPQAATIVLREANRPLHVSEIYRRLSEGGFEFRGQHHLITLAVSLSRSKRFRKVAPGTFELDPDFRDLGSRIAI